MSKKQIYKPKPISGFPEWLPETRMVEQQWLDHIRRVFESYGYVSIETPAAEEIDILTAKGETDKEIYTLTRLQADEDDKKEARIGLHFDQTVPFARYTAMHFNELDFPFKRYAMQKVWRGERPQLGRMREFYQCDIDVIHVDHLPLHFDAEMPAVIHEALEGLDIGSIQIGISNRKILKGLLNRLNEEQQTLLFRILDKKDKLEKGDFESQVKDFISQNTENETIASYMFSDIKTLLAYRDNLITLPLLEQIEILAKIHDGHIDYDLNQELKANSTLPNFKHPTTEFFVGLEELIFVLKNLKNLPENSVVCDFCLIRGLDYYTGTVYETRLLDIPEFTSSVCSGGRYDDLAGSYINKHLPGVGISIGFTRLFDVLRHNGYIKNTRKTPTDILVALPKEKDREIANQAAQTLRQNGWNVEVYHAPQKIAKQIGYAEKKGIPSIYFPDLQEVKDMTAGTQSAVTIAEWVK